MKKLFLFLAVAALGFTSCSDDDDNNNPTYTTGGTVTMKINGVQKTYTTISVDRELYTGETPGDDEYLLSVTASENGSATEFVTFDIWENSNGAGGIDWITYVTDGDNYSQWGNFNSNVLASNNHELGANFSGEMIIGYDENNDLVVDEITEGSINVTYE